MQFHTTVSQTRVRGALLGLVMWNQKPPETGGSLRQRRRRGRWIGGGGASRRCVLANVVEASGGCSVLSSFMLSLKVAVLV